MVSSVSEEFTHLTRRPLRLLMNGAMRLMYASGPSNGVYHLVVADSAETLCGLKVSRMRFGHSLHLVSDVSTGDIICKHCERIKKNAKTDND